MAHVASFAQPRLGPGRILLEPSRLARFLRAFCMCRLTCTGSMMYTSGTTCSCAKVVSLSFLDCIPMHFLYWLPAKAQYLQGNMRLVAMDTHPANKTYRTSPLPNTPTKPVLWVIRWFYPLTFPDTTRSHSFHVQEIDIQRGLANTCNCLNSME